jgi:NADH dehydrogenase [ubiquinone] 1 alpha subcomplex assembly factor 2
MKKDVRSCVHAVAQWHQWLRHTRPDPPSVQEQQYDVSRQAMMKQLAAKADERWKSVPSFLDSPNRQQTQPAMALRDPGGYVPQTEPESNQGVASAVEDPDKVQEVAAHGKDGKTIDEGRFKGRTKETEPPPWAQQQRGAPSENWQPESWTPGVTSRR